MQSIKDKGILEPLLVTKGDGDSYTLICGERRFEAARQLEHESVPVRVIEAGKESGETIALQLTENLQRVATHGTDLRYRIQLAARGYPAKIKVWDTGIYSGEIT